MTGGTELQVAHSGISIIDPRNGKLIDRVQLLLDKEVTEVVAAATAGFAQWRGVSIEERCRVIGRMADILESRASFVAQGMAQDIGKTESEALVELDRSVATLRWAARTAPHVIITRSQSALPGLDLRVTADPVGPVLAIVPSNFPAVVTARKLGPALAAGCSVVVKGPETAPAAMRMFAEVAAKAGLPDNVVQWVFADPEVSAQLVAQQQFRVVSFTGSTQVGRAVAAGAAPGMTQCILELGGHAPAIVLPGADLVRAATELAAAKFSATGQSCAAPSRFIVHESVCEEFVEHFIAAAPLTDRENDAAGRVGTMGPLHSEARRDAVHAMVEDAIGRGARLRIGGVHPRTPGYYYPATVLTEVPTGARVLVEEPFGPIAPVTAYATDDQAVALANDSAMKLGAFVYGAPEHAAALADRIDAGRVSVNCATGADPVSPLSGRGDSGYGYEGGEEGLLAFLRLKVLHSPALALESSGGRSEVEESA